MGQEKTRKIIRLFRQVVLTLLTTTSFLLTACGIAGPGPALYVLGSTPAAETVTAQQMGLPIIEVKPVGFPNYLDSTDLLLRKADGEVVPSLTGQWGERLSQGFTHALASALGRQLPGMAITATRPICPPARQILVDVEAFEAQTNGKVVLVARWTVTDGMERAIFVSERTSLTEPISGNSDAAIVAAMTSAVEHFAEQIAAEVRATSGQK